MKKVLSVCVLGMWSVGSAFAATSAYKPDQAVAASARSVVGLAAVDASGQTLVQNSGVVVAHGLVTSSCHVLATPGTSKFVIEYRHKIYPAKLHKLDVPDDACSFVSSTLPAPPATVNDKLRVSAGQNVYVVGATDAGLPVILPGKLSALHKSNGMTVRWLSIPVTANAVGGGVFDARGRLIGIDSLGASPDDKGNIALPLDELDSLSSGGASSNKPDGGHGQVNPEDLLAVDMLNHGHYAAASKILTPLAEKGDARAQHNLSGMYDGDYGIPENDSKMDYWIVKSARQGNVNAQCILGYFYMEGAEGVSKDDAMAAYWLNKAAQRSVAMAQAALALLYLEGHGVPKDLPDGIRLMRRAADQGLGMAQLALGGAYMAGTGVKRNEIQGAKWLMLAKASGTRHAARFLSKIEEHMTTAQIAKVQQLARQWSAQHPVE